MGARPAGGFMCTTHWFLGFSWLSEVPWSGDIQAIFLGQCKSASVSDEVSVFLWTCVVVLLGYLEVHLLCNH